MRAMWALVAVAVLVAVAAPALLHAGGRARIQPELPAERATEADHPTRTAGPAPSPGVEETAPPRQDDPSGPGDDSPAPAPRSRLEIQVVDTAGRPIELAQIERTWARGSGWGFAGITDADGRCEFHVDGVSPLRLRVTAPRVAGEVIVEVPEREGERPFRIVVGGEARGSIRIELGPAAWNEAALCVVAVPAAGSDEAPVTGWLGSRHGPVVVRGARPGTWFVRVVPRWSLEWGSRLPLEYEVEVEAGQEKIVVPTMEPGRTIRGVLRLPDGSPPPRPPRDAWIRGTGGAKVTLTYRWPSEIAGRAAATPADVMDRPFAWEEWDVRIDGSGSSSRYVISPRETTIGVRPDAEGRFVSRLMPTWPITLRVEQDGAILHESVVIAGDNPLEVTLKPVDPCLRLLVPESDFGAYDWRLTVWREGRLVGDQSGAGPELTLAGIPPGPCLAVVQRFDRTHWNWSTHPQHGEFKTQSLDQSWHEIEIGESAVTLRPNPRRVAQFWVGVVEDESGGPLNGWTGTFIWRGHEWTPACAFMNRSDWPYHYCFRAPPDGPFQVRFSAPGRVPVTRDVEFGSGEWRALPDVRLVRAG